MGHDPSLLGPLEIAKWVCVVLFVASTIGVLIGDKPAPLRSFVVH